MATSATKTDRIATTSLLAGVVESRKGQNWQQGRPGRGAGADGIGALGSFPQQWWHTGRLARAFGAAVRAGEQHHPGGNARRHAVATITSFGHKARIMIRTLPNTTPC